MIKIFKSPKIKNEEKNNRNSFLEEIAQDQDDWSQEDQIEGQLAIDVYQTKHKIIIKSTIAGVKPEDLKISLHHDLLSIKGHRHLDENIDENDYLFKECYWGNFSRAIILPSEVDPGRIDAVLENGILTISLEKIKTEPVQIAVQEEESE